jgi:multiple sugar transport system permease protein
MLLPFNPRWLIDHELLSIVVANTWRGTAFSMLLFGAALNSLPPSYLETARLAGASTRQQLTGVVLPSIKGYILTNLLLISLWTFNDFGPFLLIGSGLGRRTEVLPVYLYYEAFRAGNRFGYGAAIAAIIMAINLVIASFYLRAGRRRA